MLLVLDYAKVYVGYMVIFGLVKSENRLFFIYAFLALPGDKKNGLFWLHFAGLKDTFEAWEHYRRYNGVPLPSCAEDDLAKISLSWWPACLIFSAKDWGIEDNWALYMCENKWLLKWCMFFADSVLHAVRCHLKKSNPGLCYYMKKWIMDGTLNINQEKVSIYIHTIIPNSHFDYIVMASLLKPL